MMYLKVDMSDDESGVSGRMPESVCPHCEEPLDGATSIEVTNIEVSSMPEQGDISLCAYCGEILEFDKNMQLILVKATTWAEMDLEAQTELLSIQSVIRSSKNPFN